MSIISFKGNRMVMSNDFTMDAHLSTLNAERRRLKRGDLTGKERERVINEVKQRIANGEDPLDLLDDYVNRWMENKY